MEARVRDRGYEIDPTVSGEGRAGYARQGNLGHTFAEKAHAIRPTARLLVIGPASPYPDRRRCGRCATSSGQDPPRPGRSTWRPRSGR
jgi:hypothetical protein